MPNNETGKNDSKHGFFNKLKNSLKAFKNEGLIGSEFREEKESIQNYEEIFSNEKKLRGGETNPENHKDTEYTIPQQNDELDIKKQTISGGEIEADKTKVNTNIDIEKEKSRQISNQNKNAKEKLVSISEKWKAPRILKTNLIKGEITTFIDWKKNIKILSANITLVFLFISVIYFGLIFWEINATKQSLVLGGEISDLKIKIDNTEKEVEKVDIFQEKLKYAKLLLKEHVYWTNIFSLIEENLLKEVVITSDFSGDLNGEFKFSAQTDSYKTIAKQIKIFKANDKISSVNISGGKLATTETAAGKTKSVVNFDLVFNIDTSVFNK